MWIAIVIISALLWIAGAVCLWKRPLWSPALAYVALVVLSLASRDGSPLLPINGTILLSWLAITIVTMITVLLQPDMPRNATASAYLLLGAVVGMALSLPSVIAGASPPSAYSLMIGLTALSTVLWYVAFTLTPAGRAMGSRAHFWSRLAAWGFPVAVCLMQLGVALVLTLLLNPGI